MVLLLQLLIQTSSCCVNCNFITVQPGWSWEQSFQSKKKDILQVCNTLQIFFPNVLLPLAQRKFSDIVLRKMNNEWNTFKQNPQTLSCWFLICCLKENKTKHFLRSKLRNDAILKWCYKGSEYFMIWFVKMWAVVSSFNAIEILPLANISSSVCDKIIMFRSENERLTSMVLRLILNFRILRVEEQTKNSPNVAHIRIAWDDISTTAWEPYSLHVIDLTLNWNLSPGS